MKLKHIALAVLAATGFGAAHASVSTTQTNAELFFYAYSADQSKFFLLDTGVASTSLSGGTINYSYDLSADANWTSFVSAVGAANISWYVEAASSASSTTANPNAKFVYATLGLNQTPAAIPGKNPSFNTANLTNALSLATTVTTGTSFTGTNTDAGYLASTLDGLAVNGVTSFSNLLGTTGVSFFGAAASNASSTARITQFATPAALASATTGLLTIAAPAVVPSVPEPESYGLALVGLLLAGAVARRRAA